VISRQAWCTDNCFVDVDVGKGGGGDALKTYKQACKSVPSSTLREHFYRSCSSSSEFYYVQRHFATQLGVQAAKQLLINARALSADQMLISPDGEVITTPSVRPFYEQEMQILSSQKRRVLGNIAVPTPLRLTRNICGALSPALVRGILCTALGVTLDAFEENKDEIDFFLRFLFLYDLHEIQESDIGVGGSGGGDRGFGTTATGGLVDPTPTTPTPTQANILLAKTMADQAWHKSVNALAPSRQPVVILTQTPKHAEDASFPSSANVSSTLEGRMDVVGSEETSQASPPKTEATKETRKTPIDSQLYALIDASLNETCIAKHNLLWLPQL